MANLYGLKKFDLNLLVIFESVYRHLSISKAAETLFITPSAVSQSLQRLRLQFDDPLFVRSGKGITPTTVAVNLHHHLDTNLSQLEQTIQLSNRTDVSQIFVIYAPQLLVIEPVRQLFSCLHKEPNVLIEHYDMMASKESTEHLLKHRKADLVLTYTPTLSRSTVCRLVSKLNLILVCSASHPRLSDKPSLEDLLAEKCTSYITDEPFLKLFGMQDQRFFQERKVGFRSNSYFATVNIISNSELIGFMPEDIYKHYKSFLNLKKIEIPFFLPVMNFYMIYNRSSLNNINFSQFIEKMPVLD